MRIPDWLDAETASDASGPAWALPTSIAPLTATQQVVGTAVTALAARDDNGVIQEILKGVPPVGDVLIVAGAAASARAVIGDITARQLAAAGFRALVTDGPVRDWMALSGLPFAVWCGGKAMAASGKEYPGHIGTPVSIGGVPIETGDLVIGSASGVVIWPRTREKEFLSRAQAKHDSDELRLQAIQSGDQRASH